MYSLRYTFFIHYVRIVSGLICRSNNVGQLDGTDEIQGSVFHNFNILSNISRQLYNDSSHMVLYDNDAYIYNV